MLTISCAQLRDLPRLTSDDLRFRPAQSSAIFAADGRLITTLHGRENRTVIRKLKIVPKHVRRAVIAIEDERFWQHGGVDFKAILRAAVANARSGSIRQGGSTITQQYVKNAIIAPGETAAQTLKRKIDEAVLAEQLEQELSKRVILKRYLNTVYFGNGVYGIQTAAKTYFGKPVQKLTVSEGATLAGLIRSPESYDPITRPGAAVQRRNVVLRKMAELGWLGRARAEKVQKEKLRLQPTLERTRYPAPYFVDYVERLITFDPRFEAIGRTWRQRQQQLFTGGLRIHTTVDLDAQAAAERAIKRFLPYPRDPHASLVAIDPDTGHVRAMVGGRDWFASREKDPFAKFNLAIAGEPKLGRVKGKKGKIVNRAPGTGRQAGSAFKPFALAAAIRQGIPLTKRYDAQPCMDFPGVNAGGSWHVCNYEGQAFGPTSLLEATISSVNVVYAQLALEVGPAAVVNLARRMGIRTRLQPVASAVLGTNPVNPLGMASSFGTFATNGVHHPPVAIKRITDAAGKVLYKDNSSGKRILDAEVSYIATSALEQVIQRGTGVAAGIGRPAAGKTGTAEEYRDAWFVGYTPDLVAAVSVGYPQGEIEMKPVCPTYDPGACRPTRTITGGGVVGGSFPALIWRAFMLPALAGVPPSSFVRPATGIVTVVIDTRTGCLAGSFTPPEYRASGTFAQGTQPTKTCPQPSDRAEIPSVVGLPAAKAVQLLRRAGFNVVRQDRTSSGEPAGEVLSQDPAGGTRALLGTAVTIVVSAPGATPSPTASATATVPSVVGDKAGQAVAALKSRGFSVKVVTQAEADKGQAKKNKGRVWKQSPASGATVKDGATVTIWVNPG